jgi:putative Mg2+ transporter-C (MgtC) family protein
MDVEFLPQGRNPRFKVSAKPRAAHYATTKDSSEAHVRALLLQAVSGHDYQLRAIESADLPRTSLVEVRAELVSRGRNDTQIEHAAGHLGLEPNVTSVR